MVSILVAASIRADDFRRVNEEIVGPAAKLAAAIFWSTNYADATSAIGDQRYPAAGKDRP